MLNRVEPQEGDDIPKGISLYLAGPSRGWEWCHQLKKALVSNGYSITHDWMAEFSQPDLKIAGMLWPARCADNDVLGVRQADIVLARVIPFIETTGMWFELGLAVGLGKEVLVWLDYQNPLATNKAEVHDHDELCKEVKEWSDRQVFLHAREVTVVLDEVELFLELQNKANFLQHG